VRARARLLQTVGTLPEEQAKVVARAVWDIPMARFVALNAKELHARVTAAEPLVALALADVARCIAHVRRHHKQMNE
jgi:hypothetical protein